MEFRETLLAAQRNQQQKSSESLYYKARFDPPKKEQKQRDKLSANIQKFLAKKDEEEKQKKLDTQRKRDELLAMRDPKALRKIQKTLKVIKSANKSVIEDAVDRDNTAVTLSGPDQPDQDDYGYESQEAAAIYAKMMQKYSKIPDVPKFPTSNQSVKKDLKGTMERVKHALQHEDDPVPHKRRRRTENGIDKEDSPTRYEPEKERKEEKKPDKPKIRKPMPPPMDFNQLLKLAEQKKSEPVTPAAQKKQITEGKTEHERPMTKKQRREYEEEMARRQRRQERLDAQKNPKRPQKEREEKSAERVVQRPSGFGRIPKLNDKNSERNNSPRPLDRDRTDRDRNDRDRNDRDRNDRYRNDRDRNDRDRNDRDRNDRDRNDRDRNDKDRNDRDRNDRDRNDRDRNDRDRNDRDRNDRDRNDRDWNNRDRINNMQREKDRVRQERDRLEREKERVDREKDRIDTERLERLKAERERIDRELEKLSKDKERLDKTKTQIENGKNTDRSKTSSSDSIKKSIDLKSQNTYRIDKNSNERKIKDEKFTNGHSAQGKVPKSKEQMLKNVVRDKTPLVKQRVDGKPENGKRMPDGKIPMRKPDDRPAKPQAGSSQPKLSNSFDFDKHVNSLKKEVGGKNGARPAGNPKRRPHPDDVTKKPNRRVVDSESEYDSEMDDFIDDGDENMDYSKHIKEIFGYDKSKYRDVDDDDDRTMESSFARQQREEFISKKIGIMEDLEDMRMEALEKKKSKKIRRISDD